MTTDNTHGNILAACQPPACPSFQAHQSTRKPVASIRLDPLKLPPNEPTGGFRTNLAALRTFLHGRMIMSDGQTITINGVYSVANEVGRPFLKIEFHPTGAALGLILSNLGCTWKNEDAAPATINIPEWIITE